ncbi:MAG: hypothetical protein HXY20_07720 [Acidobacteria bacterium]|nr:hypothetical protein [Acidobacteriota bacterium]
MSRPTRSWRFFRRAATFGAACLLLVGAAIESETAGREPGLIGIVFGSPTLAGPVRVWSVLLPDAELFAPVVQRDFGLTLVGWLTAPSGGLVRFRAVADDGVRLRVRGKTVIDGWSLSGAREGSAEMSAGIPARLQLDYYQDGGRSELKLYWLLTGRSEWERIPAEAFHFTSADRNRLNERFSRLMAAYERLIFSAPNPRPREWPALALVRQGARTMLRATFPDVPEFTCDAWLYESDVDFLGARPAGGGRLELRHRYRAHPGLTLVSEVRPERGAIEIGARIAVPRGIAQPLPSEVDAPNLCWQVKRSPPFSSFPDPYPMFTRRCFIFTDKGLTFLDRTVRNPSARFDADDPVNNPPWVQTYLAAWAADAARRPFEWAGISPDRYEIPVAGVVSRDRRFLAALASDTAVSISQVWLDCLHNNAEWAPAHAPLAERRWRVKIYAAPNDPAALLRRIEEDFPGIPSKLFPKCAVPQVK